MKQGTKDDTPDIDDAVDKYREERAELAAEDWENEPWADPAIAAEYKAALGDFVVAFNQLDSLISKLICNALDVLKRPDLQKRYLSRSFAAKVDALELLGLSKVLRLDTAPLLEVRNISSMRNRLVHAHFDQNPFDGSYVLIQPKDGKEDYVGPAEIKKWSERAQEAWQALRYFDAVYVFRDIKVDPPSL